MVSSCITGGSPMKTILLLIVMKHLKIKCFLNNCGLLNTSKLNLLNTQGMITTLHIKTHGTWPKLKLKASLH